MEVGGYGSSLNSSNWGQLGNELQSAWGYADADIIRFSYRSWHVSAGSSTMVVDEYTTSDTCDTIDSEVSSLGGMLRYLRDNHWADNVSVVGHSLGGVLSVQALIQDPSLAPFVRSVIAVDSPFGGVTGWSGLLGCGALNELADRRAQVSAWDDYYAAKLQATIGRGLQLRVVTNPDDDAVGYDYQCICRLAVNFTLHAPGHSAVFFNPAHVRQIASWIGPQGQ